MYMNQASNLFKKPLGNSKHILLNKSRTTQLYTVLLFFSVSELLHGNSILFTELTKLPSNKLPDFSVGKLKFSTIVHHRLRLKCMLA